MPGRPALKPLEQLIRKGEVDTVLTVFPDTFGRLMGKRVVGSYFLDHVADEGAHACIYLFTVDMEMEPLPGFKLDRKSTRLNSSHSQISYAVFCLKKKKKQKHNANALHSYTI